MFFPVDIHHVNYSFVIGVPKIFAGRLIAALHTCARAYTPPHTHTPFLKISIYKMAMAKILGF